MILWQRSEILTGLIKLFHFKIHQYQVTEQVNDQLIRDPYTGKQKFYAPDPDQSVPIYKISPPIDVLNQFNQTNSIVPNKQIPIEISFLPTQNHLHTAPVASALPLIQLANPVPQQQLPDTYSLPIGSQPQLQQHLLQQQSMLQGIPVSVYNPTYLVTQSNNLLKQHRDQLFKPAPAFLGTINNPNTDMSPAVAQPLFDVNSVASPGQILQSSQSQQKAVQQQDEKIQEQQQQQQEQKPNAVPLRADFSASIPVGGNAPTFQRYTAEGVPPPSSSSSIIFGQTNFPNEVQQPLLTENELNNLMNFGNIQNVDDAGGFIPTFYKQPDPEIEVQNRQRQQINELTINQANDEQKNKLSLEVTNNIPATPVPKIQIRKPALITSAHEQHQKKLAEQFDGKTTSTLRIIVPDDENNRNQNVCSLLFAQQNLVSFHLSKNKFVIFI